VEVLSQCMFRESDDEQEASPEPTVLFVEDEPDIRELYPMIVGDAYDVRTAPDGDVSPELIDRAVDIVFLDRRMPGVSGDELLRRLRDRGIETPVVITSAVDRATDLDATYQAYLEKPLTKTKIRTHVERYAATPATAAGD